ncbi:MAG: hypothetical protein KGR26_01680 [Cyanobacteria bacterium REEB65]|nr:hypothetical protein [Cyanobacteria bacterium REEB65]
MSEFEHNHAGDQPTRDSRLGQILIRRGAITEGDLVDALRVQQGDPERPLGEVLISQHAATSSQVREALREQLSELRLGQILLRIHAIEQQALDEALNEQARVGGVIGELLVAGGACSAEQVAWALSQQNSEKRFGSMLLRRKLITPEQLDSAMGTLAFMPEVLLAEVLVEAGFLTSEQVQEATQFLLQEAHLGQILISQGTITDNQLEKALLRQSATGQLLGEILVSSGMCSLDQIGRALEVQYAGEPSGS